MLLAYIETTDWNHTDLRNIEPEIVQRYGLEKQKQALATAWWATSCDTNKTTSCDTNYADKVRAAGGNPNPGLWEYEVFGTKNNML